MLILNVDWPRGLSHFLAVIDVEKAFSNLNVVDATPTAARIEWQVPADLPYLNGHFPGFPVVPAVGIVDVSVEGLRRSLQVARVDLLGIPSAKFLSPFTPGDRLTAEFSASASAEGAWTVEWKEPSGKTVALLDLEISVDNALRS